MAMDSVTELNLDRSSQRYAEVANTFRLAAAEMFDIDVSDQVHELWTNTLVGIRRLDILVDDTEESGGRDQYATAINFLAGNTDVLDTGNQDLDGVLVAWRLSMEILSERERQFLIWQINQVFTTVSERIRGASTAVDLADGTRLEGQMVARLFMAPYLDQMPHVQRYRSFARWLTRLGRFADVFDTFVDLSTDYESSKTVVAPTATNRAKLLWRARGDFVEAAAKSNLALLTHLGKRTSETIKGRRYRYDSYSS